MVFKEVLLNLKTFKESRFDPLFYDDDIKMLKVGSSRVFFFFLDCGWFNLSNDALLRAL